MDREETRGAALAASPRGPALPMGVKEIKLPMLLTARPGNIGVQIDAFRTMKMFNRPRCGKFTAQFLGINYQNHSMENYSRVVERTQVRARIVGERLEKLKQHEAHLIADEQRRRQRRKEREAAEQRHQWQMRQAAKRDDERAREDRAALAIQRVVRGLMARCRVDAMRQHGAATRLQTSMRAFVRKRRVAKQRHEREKERRLQAAKTIQHQARKRRESARHVDALVVPPPENDAVELPPEPELTTASAEESPSPGDESETPEPPIIITTDAADLDLELLLSITPTPSSEATATPTPPRKPPQARPVGDAAPIARPRRPVTIKRVGGGFRQSAAFQSPRLRTSRPPELAQAIAPRPPPPQPQRHHQPHSVAHATKPTAPQRVSPRKSPRKGDGDADADETALLELVVQLDLAVSALMENRDVELLEHHTLEPGDAEVSGT